MPRKQAIEGCGLRNAASWWKPLPSGLGLWPVEPRRGNVYHGRNKPRAPSNYFPTHNRIRSVIRGCRNAPRKADARPLACLIAGPNAHLVREPSSILLSGRSRARDAMLHAQSGQNVHGRHRSVSPLSRRVSASLRSGMDPRSDLGTAAGVPRWMESRSVQWPHSAGWATQRVLTIHK
jgi:hypothetical protein